MKDNILLVEDDLALRDGIILALRKDDFAFFSSSTINYAKDLCSNNHFDLIILDINLPDGSGLDFLTYIKNTMNVAVILLTAKDMEIDIVTGLEMGADDYITKPFSLMILRARVNAQLRKLSFTSVINIDDFSFNFDAMEYRKANKVIELSKTEQKLLRLLLENKGKSLTREVLVDRIWTDGAEYVDENALSVTIKRLRDKLESTPSKPKYIKTIYGIGYTWAVK